ncbi:MAG: FxsA family protein [Bacillota bacterium]
MVKFLLLFTLVPLIEVWILIEVGSIIGTAPTILLIASTGFIGVFLAKYQGITVLYKMQMDLQAGIVPAEQLFDGGCILVGGALLLTPGLITDALGFSLLLPFTRIFYKAAAQKYFSRQVEEGNFQVWWHR